MNHDVTTVTTPADALTYNFALVVLFVPLW
jgi:hypothetical protein